MAATELGKENCSLPSTSALQKYTKKPTTKLTLQYLAGILLSIAFEGALQKWAIKIPICEI